MSWGAGILLLFCPLLLWAQEPSQNISDWPLFQHPLDEVGLEVLHEEVGKKLDAIDFMRANFEQKKKVQVLRRPLISRGTFLFERELGVCWDFKHPFPSRYTITEHTILQDGGDGQPKKTNTKAHSRIKQFSEIFSAIFAAETQSLSEHFQIYFSGNSVQWEIGLIPENFLMRKVISHIVLSGGETVERVRILETNEDFTDIHFTAVETTGELTSEEIIYFEEAR